MALSIKSVSPKKVLKTVKSLKNIKIPDYDLITAEVLKQLPKKGIMLMTALFNGILRIDCYPAEWKIAQIIVIPKPRKNPIEVSSYRPINLLPLI